ncbi:hypothetical protein ABPG77_002125 [Micractinium sp. CCAP 211/92]
MSTDPQSYFETCRYCLQAEDGEEGGSLILPCACRTPVHQRCLRQWLYHNNRGDAQRCELCREEWRGALSVDIQEVVQRLGAAQQGIPKEMVEGNVRAVADIYNDEIARLMLECERQRQEVAKRAIAAMEEVQEHVVAMQRQLPHRLEPLFRAADRMEKELGAQRAAVRRLRLQRWVLLPLTLVWGIAIGVMAGDAECRQHGPPERYRRHRAGVSKAGGGASPRS